MERFPNSYSCKATYFTKKCTSIHIGSAEYIIFAQHTLFTLATLYCIDQDSKKILQCFSKTREILDLL